MRVVRPTEIGRSIAELAESKRFNSLRIASRSLATVETWKQPALLNGWINYEDYDPNINASRLSYLRDASGVVHWRGVLRGIGVGTSGSWSQVCQVQDDRWWSENEELQLTWANISRDGSLVGGWPTIRFYQGGLYVRVEPGHAIDYPFIFIDGHGYWGI